jgi:hypothetical protein
MPRIPTHYRYRTWAGAVLVAVGAACSGGDTARDEGGQEFHGAMTIVLDGWAEGSLLGLATWSEKSFRIDSEDIVPAAGACLDPEFAFFGNHFLNPIVQAGTPTLDAGQDIALTASSLELNFTRGDFYGVVGTSLDLSPASVFTIANSGGADISPFVGGMTSPSDLVLTNPMPGPGGVTIDLSLGLSLAWVSTGGVGFVHVMLSQVTVDEEVRSRICTFPDTGSAVLTASQLGPFSTQDFEAQLSIGKTSVGAFTAGEAGLTYTQFTTTHTWEAEIVD